MFRAFNSARKNGLTSSVAMALALATGAAVGVAGFAEPAYAQKKPKVEYSKGFVAAYTPLEQAQKALGEAGDYSSLKPLLPAMIAAIESADDRFAAGQMVLTVGNKTSDPVLQRQGLELSLASGKVDPAQAGRLHFFVANLAFQANDFAATRSALEAATAGGYVDDQIYALMAESYFKGGAPAEGLVYLSKLAKDRAAAGTPVPEAWLKRGLVVAWQNKLVPQANEMAALLVARDPTPKSWETALQVVAELNTWDRGQQLDLSRLMMLSGGMTREFDLSRYVQAADARMLSNEVITALDTAKASGLLQNAQRFASDRAIAEERAAGDRADAAKSKAAAQAAASGTVALGAGDLFLSIGSYADAEAMYQLAIDKGGIDNNVALTRKGIAQVRQGKAAEAKATFAQVQGARAQLAQLWAIYAGASAAPAVAAVAGG